MAGQTSAAWVPLGAGTAIVTLDGATAGTPLEFSCEVLGASVTHEYEDAGDARTMLCGQKRQPGATRNDGFKAEVENDLSAAGLYKFLLDNDMKLATVDFVPNTADGAAWKVAGITLLLPDEIGAGEFGEPIASEIEWTGGTATFTPSKAAAAAAPAAK